MKAYLDETETVAVRGLMAAGPIVVSRLSHVEVASAVNRRWRDGLISAPKRDAAIDAFLDDAKRWWTVELTDEVSVRAVALLRGHTLRAGDAIQLASALIARDRSAADFGRFIAYDARLLAAARAEGLPIEDY